MMAVALLTGAAVPGRAQPDVTAAKQAVRECVALVRRAATLRENYDQFGQPPMWRNFDAFVAPDGRVHDNTKFVGEQGGVYLFEKCLADRGFSLGSVVPTNAPNASNTCTQQELDFHPGDCWIKLSVWEKRLTFVSFEYGWLQSFGFAERQQYDKIGSSHIRFLVNFDASKMIAYFDSLYSTAENRNITWDDAFDLLFRTQTNPATKDIPGLIALYRNHLKPLFSGYLQKFVPPDKVVISEFSGAFVPAGVRNETVTLTLLGVSSDKNTNTSTEFMAALLNVKACNTLVRQTDEYKFFSYLNSEKQRQQAKEVAERSFYPQLAVVIQYPLAYDYQQEEFFNGKDELSGIVLLDKGQSVCARKEGDHVVPVKLGGLMLEDAKDQNEFSAEYFRLSAANDFIDLNQYLVANGIAKADHDDGDPRQARQYYGSFIPDPTPEGVKKILIVGAGP
jgi:hypothetical protein